MHLEQAERLSTVHDEGRRGSIRVLGGFRWRLGLERAAWFGLRGLMVGAAAIVGVSLVATRWLLRPIRPLARPRRWPTRWPRPRSALDPASLAAVLLVPVIAGAGPGGGALALGLQAARAASGGWSSKSGWRPRWDRAAAARGAVRSPADARRGRGRSGDAGGWLAFDGRARQEVLLAVFLVALAVVSLALPSLPPADAADPADRPRRWSTRLGWRPRRPNAWCRPPMQWTWPCRRGRSRQAPPTRTWPSGSSRAQSNARLRPGYLSQALGQVSAVSGGRRDPARRLHGCAQSALPTWARKPTSYRTRPSSSWRGPSTNREHHGARGSLATADPRAA